DLMRDRRKKTVILLQGLDTTRPEDRSPSLIQALRSWAHDSQVMTSESLIILLCGDLSRVLDDLTSDLVALQRPALSSEYERRETIEATARVLGVDVSGSCGELARAAGGLSIHQLQSALVEAHHLDDDFRVERLKDLKSELIKRSDLLELEEPDSAGFDSVGGYDAVKRFIRDCVVQVLLDSERARVEKLALPLPRGVLFFGPPGTGKTLFAKALAHGTNLPFINLRTENLFSKYLGESGQRFRDAIRLAEQMSPAILFVDEIDRFGKRTKMGGSDGASEESRRVFNQILEWLGDQKRRSIIIGTTNRPQDLDPAFLRPGRFDYKIPFLYPPPEARQRILDIHLGRAGSKAKVALGFPEADLQKVLARVVAETDGFSGAEIEQLVTRAKRNAFKGGRDHLVAEDFFAARKAFRIDMEQRAKDTRSYLSQAAEFTDDREFLEEVAQENRTEIDAL
ncbi:MAG: ATP-binding protein, partial [Candidatus Binatia bacterium]